MSSNNKKTDNNRANEKRYLNIPAGTVLSEVKTTEGNKLALLKLSTLSFSGAIRSRNGSSNN